MSDNKSSFFHDGYRDAIELRHPSLPGIPVIDEEYLDGYCAAINIVQDVMWVGRDAVRQVAGKDV